MDKPIIYLYSDGGADPNPGKGGFGVILKHKGFVKEFARGFILTTNNRMELMAIIFGLKQLKTEAIVQVYSDSKYIVDAVNKGWVRKWEANNWFRNKKEKAINIDLWEQLLEQLSIHEVEFNWVKGHNGHPENERCDALATLALNSNKLVEDTGYIPKENKKKTKIEEEGDLCRKCNTPVIKRINKKNKIDKKKSYYYKYYLICPKCQTIYFTEDAKQIINQNNNTLFN